MITLDTILLAIVAGGSALTAYYQWETRRFKVDVLRVKEPVKEPIESDWGIRILHPTKVMAECNVVYDGKQIPWVDVKTFERYFGVGHGSNARIPKGVERDDAKVLIKDGSKILRKYKFKDIPRYNQ